MLKVNAVQWSYFLFGLRDGHPDLLEMMRWGPWHGGEQKQVRGGTAKRIQLIRIIPVESGHEIAARLFQAVNVLAAKSTADETPQFENPICQTIEKDMRLPKKWLFSLSSTERGILFFPALPAQPHLWQQLKRARSIKEVQQVVDYIYGWLVMSAPGVLNMLQLREGVRDYPTKLFNARKLWNYPRSDRPTSDDKKIEFFAKSIAGLMQGLAPATATRKLSRWSPPKLWLTEFEEDMVLK